MFDNMMVPKDGSAILSLEEHEQTEMIDIQWVSPPQKLWMLLYT